MNHASHILRSSIAAVILAGGVKTATAYPYAFFNPSQTAATVASSINSVTIQSGDYLFTYSVDGYWSASPGGPPTGRYFTVFWPTGVQAQAITAGPLVGKGANITVRRVDGKKFGIQSFTGKLLANTSPPGGAFEVMPQLDGEDALNDPLMFDASGHGGQSFSHTPNLSGYDTYKFHLWVDWAMTALGIDDPNPPTQGTTFAISAVVSPSGAGTASGGGIYPENDPCTVTAVPNQGWAFQQWTENGAFVSDTAVYSFTVGANRSLTAEFVANQPPVASGGAFYQLSGRPLAIGIYDLTAFDFDPDGGPVSFAGTSATTDNGLLLTVDYNTMQVIVPPGTVSDGFTYTIQDQYGSTATGVATISPIDSAMGQSNGLDLATTPGSVIANFTGVPWYHYTVQRSVNLVFSAAVRTWQVQAWADGSISVSDDFADLGAKPERAFYRLSYP